MRFDEIGELFLASDSEYLTQLGPAVQRYAHAHRGEILV
jgi:hypothetical protein